MVSLSLSLCQCLYHQSSSVSVWSGRKHQWVSWWHHDTNNNKSNIISWLGRVSMVLKTCLSPPVCLSGERRLHPDCLLLDVYRVNPHCDWLIKPWRTTVLTYQPVSQHVCYLLHHSDVQSHPRSHVFWAALSHSLSHITCLTTHLWDSLTNMCCCVLSWWWHHVLWLWCILCHDVVFTWRQYYWSDVIDHSILDPY